MWICSNLFAIPAFFARCFLNSAHPDILEKNLLLLGILALSTIQSTGSEQVLKSGLFTDVWLGHVKQTYYNVHVMVNFIFIFILFFLKQTNYAARLHDVARKTYKAMPNVFYIANGGLIHWRNTNGITELSFSWPCTRMEFLLVY